MLRAASGEQPLVFVVVCGLTNGQRGRDAAQVVHPAGEVDEQPKCLRAKPSIGSRAATEARGKGPHPGTDPEVHLAGIVGQRSQVMSLPRLHERLGRREALRAVQWMEDLLRALTMPL